MVTRTEGRWCRLRSSRPTRFGHGPLRLRFLPCSTLSSVLVVNLFAWGSLPLAGLRMGALWGMEGGYTPYSSQQSPNNPWSAGSKKERDITSTLRVILPLKDTTSAKSAHARTCRETKQSVATGRRRSGPQAPGNQEGWSSHSTTSRNRKRESATVNPNRKLAIQECTGIHKRVIRMSSKPRF